MSEEAGSFAKLLRDHRRAAALTQEALAARAEVSERNIRALESGRTAPQRETARRLADALRLTGEEHAAFLAAAAPRPRRRDPAVLTPEPLWPSPPVSSLVGRDADVADVLVLLRQGGGRLLTLTGPGGVGKTRLALAVALEAQRDMRVAFIPLAALDSPDLVLPTFARALGVDHGPMRPALDALRAELRREPRLIVLDNVEHVAAVGPRLAELCADCPPLRLLITSRVVLRLRGEQVYPVAPLALAPPTDAPPPDALDAFPAVRLFVERARAARPDFDLTPANAAAIVRICALLDGLPLAIELAAPWVRTLPAATLLRRLEQGQAGPSLRLLASGARDLPARQRTMHDTIAWSYRLLPAAQRTLFRRLGVFRGGWSLAAAEALGGDLDGLDPLDGLSALVAHSLIVMRDVGGEPRFEMLETIREYALEELDASDEGDAVRGRHAAFFLALAESAEPELTGPSQAAWMRALELEHDNVRAALHWLIDRSPGLAVRLGGALWHFWYGQTHLVEGDAWLKAALARHRPGGADPQHVAKALYGAGVLARFLNDFPAARARLDEARALCREVGDGALLALVTYERAALARNESDYAGAVALFEESLALARDAGDDRCAALGVFGLGEVLLARGDIERGRALVERSLSLFRELEDKGSEAAALVTLGGLARDQGDERRAAEQTQAGLACYQEIGNKHGVAWALGVLGDIAGREGDRGRAGAYYEAGIALDRQSGNRLALASEQRRLCHIALDAGEYGRALAHAHRHLELSRSVASPEQLIESLESVAAAAAMLRLTDDAARLWGAVERLREAIGHPRILLVERARFERMVHDARGAVNEGAWAVLWAEGRAMTPDQAAAYALAVHAPQAEG